VPSGIVDNSSELPIKAGFIAEAKGRPKMNAFHDFMPMYQESMKLFNELSKLSTSSYRSKRKRSMCSPTQK